jgi:site-specific DNA-methyltransferase (adenine-specific)
MIPTSVKKYVYYEESGIVLLHGDCLEILPLFEPDSIDLVLTDPPYGESQAEWDKEKPPKIIFNYIYNILQKTGSLYYWGFWGHSPWILTNAVQFGFIPQSRIVWWFETGRPEKIAYREDTEDCYYFTKSRNAYFVVDKYLEPYKDENNYQRYNRDGKHPSSVWKHSRIFHNHPEANEHPTIKPLSLFKKIINISCPNDGIALDPFLGSGTTAVAAKNLGRKCIGIEIEEKYLKIAKERLRQEILI